MNSSHRSIMGSWIDSGVRAGEVMKRMLRLMGPELAHRIDVDMSAFAPLFGPEPT